MLVYANYKKDFWNFILFLKYLPQLSYLWKQMFRILKNHGNLPLLHLHVRQKRYLTDKTKKSRQHRSVCQEIDISLNLT